MRALRVKRRNGMRGAAAVEFAIILPVLMLLVLGIIDWGYYFFIESVIANCAREAARAGAIAQTDPDGHALTALNAALAGGRLDTTVAQHDFSTSDSTTYTAQVTYPVGSITGVSFIPVPANALGQATMRRQNAAP